MGRKIPAKKHRGVKDPTVQQARRFASIKDKINAPPRDPDEQPVPKSLMRLFGTQRSERDTGKETARGKNRVGAARAVKKGADRGVKKGAVRGAASVAALRRLPGESARSFSSRISGAVRALHDDTHNIEYPVDDSDGEERPTRRRRDARPDRPTRAQRRKQKIHEKQLLTAKEVAAERLSAPQYERVQFGDTAHAPPALPPPRRATAQTKGGARRGLLLAEQLGVAGEGRGAVRAAGGGAALAAAERERRRLAVVAAYRALKAARPTKTPQSKNKTQ